MHSKGLCARSDFSRAPSRPRGSWVCLALLVSFREHIFRSAMPLIQRWWKNLKNGTHSWIVFSEKCKRRSKERLARAIFGQGKSSGIRSVARTLQRLQHTLTQLAEKEGGASLHVLVWTRSVASSGKRNHLGEHTSSSVSMRGTLHRLAFQFSEKQNLSGALVELFEVWTIRPFLLLFSYHGIRFFLWKYPSHRSEVRMLNRARHCDRLFWW